jgi:hypothetical protein
VLSNALRPEVACGSSGLTRRFWFNKNMPDSRTILAHLGGCAPCAELLVYVCRINDLVALVRWRNLLVVHVANDRERQEWCIGVGARRTSR